MTAIIIIVSAIILLILGFMTSIIINVALLCIIYIMWTNKQ